MVEYLFAEYSFDLTEKINKMKSWIKTREIAILTFVDLDEDSEVEEAVGGPH